MSQGVRSYLIRYGAAAAASGVALLLKLALGPVIAPNAFVTGCAAVLLSAWFCGLGPGLLATGLFAVADVHYFLPLHPPGAGHWVGVVRVGLFVATSALLSWLAAAAASSRQALQRARDELEARVAERTAELSAANALLQEGIAAQQRAEEVLREREARLRRFAESDIIGLMITDLNGRVIEANDALLGTVGYTREDLLAGRLRWDDMTPPEWRDLNEQMIQQVRTSGLCLPVEKEYFRKDGSRVPILIGVAALEKSQGTCVAFVIDQTTRKQAEEALRQERNFVSTVLDTVGALVGVVDREGRIVRFNRTCEEVLGYSSAEVMGRNFWDLLPIPEEVEPAKAVFRSVLAGTWPAQYDTYWFTRAGQRRWLQWSTSLLRDPQGDVEYIVGAGIDITERKWAEQGLQESQERFELAVDGANDGMWDWNIETDAAYFSPRWASIVGCSTDELRPHLDEWRQRAHPDDLRQIRTDFWNHIEGEASHLVSEHRLRHTDGTYRWVLSRGISIRDATGKAIRMAGSLTDITERKHAEQALRESEERYRDLVENVNEVIFSVDAGGTVTFISPVIEQVSGYQPSEVIGRSFAEFICPEDLSRLVHRFERTIAGDIEPLEYRVLTKNGTTRWVRSSSRPVVHGDRLAGLTGVITDITEDRRAEETLKTHSQVLDEMLEGVTVVTEDGIICFTNRAFDAMFGYERGELLDKHVAVVNANPPEENARIAGGIIEQLKAHGTWFGEISNCRKNGTVFTSYAHISTLEIRGKRHWVSVQEDITERKHADELLRHSESRFRSLANTVAAAIFIVQGTKNTYVNPAAERITGYTAAELTQMDFWSIVHPDFQDLVRQRGLARQREEPVPAHYEVKILAKGGVERWLDYTASVIEFDGAPAVLGTAFDITERKQAEEEARQRQAELAHVLRVGTLGELAASLAHELNQPLQAIVNYASGGVRRFQSGAPAADAVRESLDEIRSEALRAGKIVGRLRDLVRKEPHRREWVDLNELVREASQLMAADARGRQITMHLDLAPELPRLQLDGVQIVQVLLNLLRNGLEAMGTPVNGERTLSIHTIRAGDDGAEVAVHDAGGGLPVAIADRVFEPFFTTKLRGLGMGLSISRSIIEAHGGRLWATPNPGGGTTFRFSVSLSGAGAFDDA